MIRRNDVPAWLPFIPAFANKANMALVSSILMPAEFATGATNFMEFANVSMSNADVLNDLAMTSVTRLVSLASKPNARKVDPATSADLARSAPDA